MKGLQLAVLTLNPHCAQVWLEIKEQKQQKKKKNQCQMQCGDEDKKRRVVGRNGG